MVTKYLQFVTETDWTSYYTENLSLSVTLAIMAQPTEVEQRMYVLLSNVSFGSGRYLNQLLTSC